MSPDLGDTAYGEGQRLVCGAPGEYQGSVEACLLPDGEQETRRRLDRGADRRAGGRGRAGAPGRRDPPCPL